MDDQQRTKKRQQRLRSIINFMQGIATTLFIIAVIVAIYLIVIYRARVTPFINYAIVFDAGSSHTEMFVYHWPADKSNGLGTTSTVNEYFVCPVLGIRAKDSKKSNDSNKLKAISDFEHHLDLLDEYFRPCLKKAVEEIPSNRHKFSPIFLGATAGMRLSRLQNATGANQIFERIREIFSNYPFQFVTARQVSQTQRLIF
jgi:Golgi nucleoside diphosphatase